MTRSLSAGAPGRLRGGRHGAQNELDRHNYPVAVDGFFGDNMESSVRDFQYKVGLTVDGVVDPHTWRELITRKPT